jgi:pantoate kinase
MANVMRPAPVTAFCPGHISGYFRRIDGTDLATTGSIGAGIVIDEGVTVTASPSQAPDVRILKRDASGGLHQIARESTLIRSAMERIGVSGAVITECRLPIGAGFGLSAAALLASLTALNQLYDCGLDTHDIARIAHETEVTHRTGLGDVAACQGGGRVVRAGAGIDGHIERRFDLDKPLYAISFGPIHTPSVLGSPVQMEQVKAAFPEGVPETVEDFFRLCRTFTDKSGLLTPEVRKVLAACDHAGVPASMTMLGNGVFAYGMRAEAVLRGFGEMYELRMAGSGVRILKEKP